MHISILILFYKYPNKSIVILKKVKKNEHDESKKCVFLQ